MPANIQKYNRREILSAASAAALMAGCKSGEEIASENTEPTVRTDIPLRILWVGSQDDVDVVTRGWSAVMSQELKVTTIPYDRGNIGGLLAKIRERAKRCDLIVYPVMAAAELNEMEALIPVSEDDLKEINEEYGRPFAAIQKGLSRFAGGDIAIPLSARQPAILAVDEAGELSSWQDYDAWVEKDLKGAAAEPLAPGWAAMSFLWRAVSSVSKNWLFSREGMSATIHQDAFVEVLELLAQTASRYKPDRLTPSGVWEQLQKLEIRGGVGFEVFSEESGEAEIIAKDLPGSENDLLFEPLSLAVSLSAGCVQSANSLKWIKWISGGEGVAAITSEIDAMTLTREKDMVTNDRSASNYQRWLNNRLQESSYQPTLQILSADLYYAALDTEIVKCLDGDVKPADALKTVAEKWDSFTQDVEPNRQQRAWRRSQGLRA